mmetsp:Transcript_1269/g.1338  ORF Transcript_1269/g.1338 Transcript_1269/m.1338 type:complete len:161 (+) Transcript_1269:312-794(+)
MSLQEKRKRKYDEKKDFYESNKTEIEREDKFDDRDSSGFANNSKLNNNIKPFTTPFDNKLEDTNMLCESTPQQYFNRRYNYDGQLGVFASPIDFQRRQFPMNQMPMNNTFSSSKPTSPLPMPKEVRTKQNNFFDGQKGGANSNLLSPPAAKYLKQSMDSP